MSDSEHDRNIRPHEPASTNAEPSESSEPLRKRVDVACEEGSEESEATSNTVRDTDPKSAPAAKVIISIRIFIRLLALFSTCIATFE